MRVSKNKGGIFKSDSVLALVADVGSTKTRVAFAHGLKGVSAVQVYLNSGFNSLEGILANYVKSQNFIPKLAIIGVAGPVKDGRAVLTNRGWKIDAKKLASFGWSVVLVNDFELQAFAIMAVKPKLLCGCPVNGPKVVLGCGTGLGEAIISDNGRVVASEGGHCSFAPDNEQQWLLKQFVIEELGFCEYESLLSGPGLTRIHKFVTGKSVRPEVAIKHDKTHSLFVEVLAQEARSLALKAKAVGGVYLAGSIVNSVDAKLFARKFCCNARFRQLLGRVPAYLVTEENAALFGGAFLARKIVFGE